MTGCLKISGDSHMIMSFFVSSSWLVQLSSSVQAGSEMNVGDYYQTAYKIKLNPNLPCLNVGGSGKPTYVPAELATVKRGQRKLKLDERQQAQMIREAAIKPLVSFASLSLSAMNCMIGTPEHDARLHIASCVPASPECRIFQASVAFLESGLSGLKTQQGLFAAHSSHD